MVVGIVFVFFKAIAHDLSQYELVNLGLSTFGTDYTIIKYYLNKTEKITFQIVVF